jgi:hypothetical protein
VANDHRPSARTLSERPSADVIWLRFSAFLPSSTYATAEPPSTTPESPVSVKERAEVPSPTPARVWGDQWLRVNEKVLKGLNHQLTNRLAALDAVTHLFEPAEATDPHLLRTLAHEVERVGTLLRLYRMLPAEPTAMPEPIRVQDIIPCVLELHTYHADLRGVTCLLGETSDPEPVCVRPSALLRSLLVLLESAAGHASRTGSGRPIVLGYGGTPTVVTISIEAPSPNADGLFAGSGSLIDAVGSALAHARGTIQAAHDSRDGLPVIMYRLTLPTLSEMRKRA